MEALGTQLLPCDSNGECMVCKKATWEEEILTCNTCATPWHLPCLGNSMPAHTSYWECPDCFSLPNQSISAISQIAPAVVPSKPRKGKTQEHLFTLPNFKEDDVVNNNQVLEIFEESLKCSFCMQLPQSPVTILCGHNFCLKCFQKWVGQGKRTCAKCRSIIPSKMVSNPCINSSLSVAIQIAKSSSLEGTAKACDFVHSQNKLGKAYSHESAKKVGKKTAFRENTFVTVPPDHFGPILAVNDPRRKQGVLVGESWESWEECGQWGAHVSYNEGISGQADYGAQSVALSCGKEDGEDHGDWFIYTTSNGRDLLECEQTSKRFHQKLETYNEALRVSFEEGYPVRVVRYSSWKILDQAEVHHNTSRINAGHKNDADYCGQHAIFEAEDQVLVHIRCEHILDEKNLKLQNQKLGPYKVLHKINSNMYVLDLPDNMGITNIFDSKDLSQESTKNSLVNIDATYLFPSYPHNEIEDIVDTKIVSTRKGSYQKYLVKWKNLDWSNCTWICDVEFQHFNCVLYEKYHRFSSSESLLTKRVRDKFDEPKRFGKYYRRERKSNFHSNMNLFDRLQRKKLPFYAPKSGIRYDGIYRIEKCWMKVCNKGCKVSHYLFVRCDNDPAPWSSGNYGDRPRSLPDIKELKTASEITERKESPSWGYNDEKERWVWLKPPPVSGKQASSQDTEVIRKTGKARHKHASSIKDRLLKVQHLAVLYAGK
ncbi:E3 ubiquitin-protein ligase ORTHRUS 2-like isoform X2 [Apium graveolens]|uniref:E3 ubiquitin-protein ligase ORTHRUS 2-like isoform X2 n=1 Tax=Apium graveolens TaxID=4045 RepID=UPI003D7A8159